MYWLLTPHALQIMQRAYASGMTLSAEQVAQFNARMFDDEDDRDSAPRILTMAGNNAEIKIEGVLTNSPNFMAFLFGGGNTTYSDIISALALAEQSPEIEKITLAINSPGGQFEGLFDVAGALQGASKPIEARVGASAASAAYLIASQAQKITVSNKASRVGSIGIVATFDIDANEVQVTSTDAPKKRPDPTTDAGKAVIREELDAMHQIFIDEIAAGRGVTAQKVNADFGQGATLLAEEAQKRGMIDGIASASSLRLVPSLNSTQPAASGINPENGIMNLQELMAQHPDVYSAAVLVGTNAERDRVSAHLTMAEASGDMVTGLAAIRDGSAMTQSLQSQYMAAGMNRADKGLRDDDDAAAAAALAAAADAGDSTDGAADAVALLVEKNFGIGAEA